jgi:malonyl-CoA/methylmalonyl-CoA synthetase
MFDAGVALPVEEASYFVNSSNQVLILHSTAAKSLGTDLVQLINSRSETPIAAIEIGQLLGQISLDPQGVVVSSDRVLDDNGAGLIIFTSGTTGRPKGAVWSRGVIREAARSFMDQYGITSDDVILHVLPVHHATGITITLTPFLIAGACIEFRSGSFNAEWVWNRWRQGGLTYFSGVPTIYLRMMRFFVQHIQPLSQETVVEYEKGANQFSGMFCGTSSLPAPVQQFWTSLRNGKAMLTRYGGTEFGAVLTVPLYDEGVPIGSVGKPMPGMDVKLSNGDEGEVLIKSPVMFSKLVLFFSYQDQVSNTIRYVADPEATRDCHDEEGYFKTGDIARIEGGNYFIMGRASVDIIKSGGYKISALDIERECLGLPYVEEVMCIGVEDEEFGQRVAAAVKLRHDQDIYDFRISPDGSQFGRRLTIHDLRRDLRGRLAGYKLPTLLRVLDSELPKTASGKVQKKMLGPQLFPYPGWDRHPEIQVWINSKVEFIAKL